VCGPSGGDKWNQDSFGAFKVVVDANKNRKVARDGSRFLYDDSVDSIIRMLWPDRVADYAQVDVDRERALLSVLVMYNVLGRYSCHVGILLYRHNLSTRAASRALHTSQWMIINPSGMQSVGWKM
jgi:hypothetical protein